MSADIQKWLNSFKENWRNKDIDSILDLFAEEVEYHETPTRKLENKEEIRDEWQSIHDQKDVKLGFEVYSKDENRHAVKWHLEYTYNSERKVMDSIYLIKLDEESRCTEFWQYCQVE